MRESATLRERLGHVYWIGGGSRAGKSTVARQLAIRHGLQCVSTDEAMADHVRRSDLQESPLLAAFLAMSMDERWLTRTPETMLDTFHWFRGEGFQYIVEDLLGLPEQSSVVVEGFRLLPGLVRPLLTEPRRALWLLPTPSFRQRAFEKQPSAWAFLNRTSDPEQALRNLLERDSQFTDPLRQDSQRLELTAIEVAGGLDEEQLIARAESLLGL